MPASSLLPALKPQVLQDGLAFRRHQEFQKTLRLFLVPGSSNYNGSLLDWRIAVIGQQHVLAACGHGSRKRAGEADKTYVGIPRLRKLRRLGDVFTQYELGFHLVIDFEV